MWRLILMMKINFDEEFVDAYGSQDRFALSGSRT
jgi:hypothetical protein